MTKNIVREIRYAIANNNIEEMYRLKDICDRIHSGIEEYNGYTKLPDDILYEEMNRKLESCEMNSSTNLSNETNEILNTNSSTDMYKQLSTTLSEHISSNSTFTKILTCKNMNTTISTTNNICFTHNRLNDLWMGSLPKRIDIAPFENAIIAPKFDGCSCGLKLERSNNKFLITKASTRGVEMKAVKDETIIQNKSQSKNELLRKLSTISSPFLELINSDEILNYKFSNDMFLKDAISLNIRGEIVLKDKSFTTSAPASFVAGKINGYYEVWEQSKDKICFIPFEFMRITFDNRLEYIPTQLETCTIFKTLQPEFIFSNTSENPDIIQSTYSSYNTNLSYPIDGIVYCSIDWRYPQTHEQTTNANYNKYAWKPSSEATTILRSIEYTIARDGKITMMTTYDPVKIGPKNYQHAKIVPTELHKLAGIGFGSVITIKLCNDTAPKIISYEEDENIKPYTFPTTCPFCSQTLITKIHKNKVTLTCNNKNCNEKIVQKMCNFLEIIKIKGCKEKTLRKIKPLNMETLHSNIIKHNEIMKQLSHTTIAGFMEAIGFGTTLQIEKACKNINNRVLISENLDFINDIAIILDDPFVHDIVNYILEHI